MLFHSSCLTSSLRGFATYFLLTLILCLNMMPSAAAADLGQWQGLGGLPGVNGEVYAMATYNGKVVVGGKFTIAGAVETTNLAQWDNATSTWSQIGGARMQGAVRALAVMGTDLWVGGEFSAFTAVNGSFSGVGRLARWNGSSWAVPTGVPGNYAVVNALAVSASDLFVAGDFSFTPVQYGPKMDKFARWNTSTSTWSNLNANFSSTVFAGGLTSLLVQGNYLYVGGAGWNAGSVHRCDLSAVTPSWADLGLGSSGAMRVNALAWFSGKLYAGGYRGASSKPMWVWNGNATAPAWTAIAGSGDGSEIYGLAVRASPAAIIAVGQGNVGSTIYGAAAWNGSTWSGLGGGMYNSNIGHAVLTSGTDVYVGGTFDTLFQTSGQSTAMGVGRWNGSAWSSLGSGWSESIGAMHAVGPDEVYAVGNFGESGKLRADLARWNGSAWLAVGPQYLGNPKLTSVAKVGANIYIGGSFIVDPISRSTTGLMRWNGSAWKMITDLTADYVYALAEQNGDLLVAGSGLQFPGGPVTGLVRVRPSSLVAADPTYTFSVVGGAVNGTVRALLVSGNDLTIGGRFTNIGGTAGFANIARWSAIGATWSPYGNGLGSTSEDVFALAEANGRVYAGGSFTVSGFPSGDNCRRLAYWNTTHNYWQQVGELDQQVRALCSLDGNVYVGGSFTQNITSPMPGIARCSGSRLYPIHAGLTKSATYSNPTATTNALAAAGGKVYVGGDFTKAGDQGAVNSARFTPPAPITVAISVPGNATVVDGPFTVQIVFSRPMSVATNPMVTFLVGSATATQILDGSGNWMATPTAEGTLSIIVPAGQAADDQGFTNVQSNTLSVTCRIINGFAAFAAHTYGEAPFTITGVTGWAGSQTVEFTSSNPNVATISGNTVTITGAGSTTVTANQAADASHPAAVAVMQILTVGKAALSVSAADAARDYGAANPVFTGVLSGVVAGDGITASFTSSAIATTPAAIYGTTHAEAVTPVLSDPNNRLSNYIVTSNKGVLNINKVALSVTANDASRGFGQANPVFTGVVSGVTAGDMITATYTSSATTSTPAGVYGPSTAQAITPVLVNSSGRLANYTVTSTKGTLSIIQPQIISGFAALSPRTYGDAAFTITGVTGGGSGQPVIFSSSNPAVATISGSTVTITGAGSAIISANQAGNATYAAAPAVMQTLTVNTATLSVTVANNSRVYGAANPIFTGSAVTGLVGSDLITATFTSSADARTAMGIYGPTTTETIVPVWVDPGSRLGNYTPNITKGTLTITQAALSVTANDTVRGLGEANPIFSGSLVGVVPGDLITANYTSSATSSTALGVYGPSTAEAITPTLLDPGSRLTNYLVTTTKGTLSIRQAQSLSGFSALAARTYGDAPFTITGVIGGASGQPVTFTSDNPAVATTSGNTVTITGAGSATISARQAGDATYAPAPALTQTLSVGVKALQVIAADASRPFGVANPLFSGSFSGLVGGDLITATFSSSANAISPQGVYGPATPEAITPTLVDPGSRLTNYSVTTTKGTLTVTAPVSGGGASSSGGGGGGGGCGLGSGLASLFALLALFGLRLFTNDTKSP